MILHNILEEFGDDPTTISGFNGKEDEEVEDVLGELRGRRQVLDVDQLYRAGLYRRKRLLQLSQQI
jgi:hypothetical protein